MKLNNDGLKTGFYYNNRMKDILITNTNLHDGDKSKSKNRNSVNIKNIQQTNSFLSKEYEKKNNDYKLASKPPSNLITEEKFTNRNLVSNNNYMKGLNDATQTNFRNELLKIDINKKMKNKSFNLAISRDHKKLYSPNQKEIKTSNINLNNITKNNGGNNIKSNVSSTSSSVVRHKYKKSSYEGSKQMSVNTSLNNNFNNNITTSATYINNVLVPYSKYDERSSKTKNKMKIKNKNNISFNNDLNTSNILTTSQPKIDEKMESHHNQNSSHSPFSKTAAGHMFITNSYSELAKKLKHNKPYTGRVSAATGSNISNNQLYFSSVFSKLKKSDGADTLDQMKLKSYEEKYKNDSRSQSNNISVDLNITPNNLKPVKESKYDPDVEEDGDHFGDIKSLRNDKKLGYKINEKALGKTGGSNSNNSFNNSLTKNNTNQNSHAHLKQSSNTNSNTNTKISGKEISLSSLKSTLSPMRSVDGPEDLHFMYVSLNQQQKHFAQRFEKEGNVNNTNISNNNVIIDDRDRIIEDNLGI